ILVGQERHIAVYAVLVVSVYTELEKNMLFHRELVGAEGFPPTGVDAFAINIVATPILRCPIHLATPPIFVNITGGKGKHPALVAFDVPFVEQRNAVLQRYTGEM